MKQHTEKEAIKSRDGRKKHLDLLMLFVSMNVAHLLLFQMHNGLG